ncbi:MAG: zinc dependent phospholipase C family protein [Daejeonella sp.]|uniref:zinc dependent phospholipase C family protein n=1 Tax=Daejeonella sp. TaxID=2805397 RepID=UPI002732E3EE|nr:zinc dependent phospholipase C family protein [Daejeonella sp.]MDP3467409.1 zinc dependent phospholipase C family protein [Daejeonella sp.]
MAVFILPGDMIRFYKNNILHITEHAVNADKRRYSDTAEAPRHFIDADRYGKNPFDNIPEKWTDAELKFTTALLIENGIIPWQIEKTYFSLVKAFRERDSIRILRLSADLGHYVSDAHVPLHTTENYNGQLSGQTGIHGFWESRLPELFSTEYDFITGPAKYLENPLKEAWKIIRNSHSLLDSTLMIEARLNKMMASDLKFSYGERKGKVERQYSKEYAMAYHKALQGMVENQMRASILMTGSYWFSAWVDAGQPQLKNFPKKEFSKVEKLSRENTEQLFGQGRIIGRPEN